LARAAFISKVITVNMSMYTLVYDISQLTRLHDIIDHIEFLRIIPIQEDLEDRYIVVIDCTARTHTLLCLF